MILLLTLRTMRERKLYFSLRWLMLFVVCVGALIGGISRYYLNALATQKYNSEILDYNGRMEIYEARISTEPYSQKDIPNAFYIGRYAVTNDQYQIVMSLPNSRPPNDPVVGISYENANRFCEFLNSRFKDQFPPGEFRLPTDIEWEYACKAGTESWFSTGDKISTSEANFDGTTSSVLLREPGIYRGTALRVGSFNPNPFGLFDMHGNITQMCFDTSKLGHGFCVRGSSFADEAEHCRSAYRRQGTFAPSKFLGFRVVFKLTRN